MVNAGSLNCRVVIQAPGTTQDEVGQPSTTPTDIATVWANILHKNGAESIRSDQDTSIVQASIRIRRRTDVTPAMQVVHAGRVYKIEAVLPDAVSREHLDLVCHLLN